MSGLRITPNSFEVFRLPATASSRQTRIDVTAVACAILTVCGLTAYGAALVIFARGLL